MTRKTAVFSRDGGFAQECEARSRFVAEARSGFFIRVDACACALTLSMHRCALRGRGLA